MSKWRIERFGLTRDREAVVILHPQAADNAGVGYVVLRFDPAVSAELRSKVVELLNGAELEARATWEPADDNDIAGAFFGELTPRKVQP
jgi:hypothetical protein